MRTGRGAAAAKNLLASTCYLSRCHGDWELGADCDQVEGKIQWHCPVGLPGVAGQVQASRWAVFCKSCGVAFPGKNPGSDTPKREKGDEDRGSALFGTKGRVVPNDTDLGR